MFKDRQYRLAQPRPSFQQMWAIDLQDCIRIRLLEVDSLSSMSHKIRILAGSARTSEHDYPASDTFP